MAGFVFALWHLFDLVTIFMIFFANSHLIGMTFCYRNVGIGHKCDIKEFQHDRFHSLLIIIIIINAINFFNTLDLEILF